MASTSPSARSSGSTQATMWHTSEAKIKPGFIPKAGERFWPLVLNDPPVWLQYLLPRQNKQASKQQHAPCQLVFALAENDGYNLTNRNEPFSVKIREPMPAQTVALASSEVQEVPWRCSLLTKPVPSKPPTIIINHGLSYLTFSTLKDLPVTASKKSSKPTPPANSLARAPQTSSQDITSSFKVPRGAPQTHISDPNIGLNERASFACLRAKVHHYQLSPNRGWLRLWNLDKPPTWVLKVVALAKQSRQRMALEPNADLPKIQFALPGGYSDHTGLSMLPSFSILVPHPTHAQQLRLARAIADVSCVVRQSKAGLIPWKCFLSEPKDARVSIEEATFKDVTFSRSSSLKEVDGKTVNVVEANFEINADFVQLGPVIPEPEWVMQIYANAWELEQNGQKPNLGVLQFGFRLKEGGSDLETRLSRLNATPAKVKFLITIPTKEDASLIKTALANNAAYRWERCTLYSNQ